MCSVVSRRNVVLSHYVAVLACLLQQWNAKQLEVCIVVIFVKVSQSRWQRISNLSTFKVTFSFWSSQPLPTSWWREHPAFWGVSQYCSDNPKLLGFQQGSILIPWLVGSFLMHYWAQTAFMRINIGRNWIWRRFHSCHFRQSLHAITIYRRQEQWRRWPPFTRTCTHPFSEWGMYFVILPCLTFSDQHMLEDCRPFSGQTRFAQPTWMWKLHQFSARALLQF